MQGWGKGWLVRKHAKLAQQVSKEAWVLWVRFSLHVLYIIDDNQMVHRLETFCLFVFYTYNGLILKFRALFIAREF